MSYNFRPDNHLFKQSSFVVNTLFEMRIWSLENEMRFKSRLAKRKSSICNLDFIFIGLSPNTIFFLSSILLSTLTTDVQILLNIEIKEIGC